MPAAGPQWAEDAQGDAGTSREGPGLSGVEIRLRKSRLCSPREAVKKDFCRQLDSPQLWAQHGGSGTSDPLSIPVLKPNFHLNTILSPAGSYGYIVNDNAKTTG